MRKLFSLLTILSVASAFAQQIITPISTKDYDKLKAEGRLDPSVNYVFPENKSAVAQSVSKVTLPPPSVDSAGSCQCMVPVDPTFSVVPFAGSAAPNYTNDDGSTTAISIPFNFCLYGTSYNSLYINNNGNVSFGASYSTFSSTPFPSNQYTMVAPFWADVDTRGAGSGLVYYKITPTYMIVKWENVGYYSMHDDKLCNFQLIMTNGTDPILPSGMNAAFCYGDMDWTTGDASSGVNGFGGTPATVGANKGDGINFIQLGRFDATGLSYTGPYANNGVDWLDNKSFFFDICGSSSNLPPISTTNSACGDTITICGYSDTLVLNSQFLAPENNQNMTLTASAPTLGSNFTILSNSGGVTGQIAFMVVGSPGLAGFHTITITATDNGVPALSTTVTYVVEIINNPIPDPVITVSPQPPCANSNPTASITNCSSYTSYVWSNGQSGCSVPINTPGPYYVTVGLAGCYKSSFGSAVIFPNPVPLSNGPLTFCNGNTPTLVALHNSSDAPYTSMVWTPGNIANDSLVNAPAGTYTITVVDTNGCAGSSTATVIDITPTATITSSPANLCPGANATLTAQAGPGATYVWSQGSTTQSIQTNVVGPYTVTVTVNSCTAQASFTLSTAISPTVTISGNTIVCPGVSTTLSASASPAGAYFYNWSNGTPGQNITVSAPGTYSVIAASSTTGCSDTSFVVVVSAPTPTVSLSAQNNNFICVGDTNIITASTSGGTSPYTYSWSPNIGSGATGLAAGAGTYTVSVSDASNCTDNETITLTLSIPTATLTATDPTICPNECDTLVATGTSGTFTWSSGIIGTNDSVVVCQPGSYTVTVTDINGCTASAIYTINSSAVPVADFGMTPPSPVEPYEPIYFTDSSYVSPGSITSWYWNFGDGSAATTQNTIHSYQQPGSYPVMLIVTNNEGCIDTITVPFLVEAPVYAPNIITPNGDDINDFLAFRNLEFFATNNLVIFDRWGKKIFEQDGYSNNWNGKGHPDGTYFYILTVPDAKDKTTFTSYFMISR